MSSDIGRELHVGLGERSYPILIGQGMMEQAATWLKSHASGSRILIVTDDNVAPLCAEALQHQLTAQGFVVHLYVVPAGESSKSYEQLQALLEWALSLGINRQSTMIALGGGVIGDLTGVAASLLLRGVDFVQIPTTLLSQVDSSVGGKTGINSSHGKNLIGAFYQPKAVSIDVDTLSTLPKRELKAGYAEVVKYALLGDAGFFDWLDAHLGKIMALDSDALTHVIATCCEHKAKIVEADEKEKGQRALLNLGHTFGHAIELHAGYGQVLHGEAVAVGMMQAAMLSVKLGMLDADVLARMQEHWQRAGLPACLVDIDIEASAAGLICRMKKDKKATDKHVVFVLMRALGNAVLHDDVPEDALTEILQETGAT